MNKQFGISSIWMMLILAVLAPILASCAPAAPAASIIQSEQVRLVAGPLDADQVSDLVVGNSAFALDLYRQLFTAEGNALISPYSLSVALAMTYAGARGETERQMAQALHFTLPQDQLHSAFNTLDQTLSGRESELAFANAIWGDHAYAFREAFLDTLAQNYGAGLQGLDFANSEEARQTINQWAADQTEQRISEVLPANSLNAATALVLTNAAYFQGEWKYAFDEDATQNRDFKLLDGRTVTVPMMQQTAELGYAEHKGLQVVELPYASDELSMVILLPPAASFQDMALGLDPTLLETFTGNLEPTQLVLSFPSFEFDTSLKLKEALMALGMVEAFGPADLSGMDGSTELFIDEVYHRAFIEVDESGTEAAAASAVVVNRKGPAVEQELTIDRPFIFLIRDRETNTILFLGHVLDPS